jgi:hypothetical protein
LAKLKELESESAWSTLFGFFCVGILVSGIGDIRRNEIVFFVLHGYTSAFCIVFVDANPFRHLNWLFLS